MDKSPTGPEREISWTRRVMFVEAVLHLRHVILILIMILNQLVDDIMYVNQIAVVCPQLLWVASGLIDSFFSGAQCCGVY